MAPVTVGTPRRAAAAVVRRIAIVVRPATPPAAPRTSRQRKARRAVVAFALLFLVANAVLSIGMDTVFPTLRDPEYGRRLTRFRARAAENPGRPAVLVFGSSRTAMGVRPAVANETPGGPMLFNFSLVGSGPVMQLMALRRTLADGVVPDAVVLEYWPAFLRQDGAYGEELRIDRGRLLPGDREFVREYFGTAAETEAIMRRVRYFPWSSHRLKLVSQVVPGFLAFDKRQDAAVYRLDDWGWLPGRADDPPAELRALAHANAAGYYRPLFAKYELSPVSDRATREMLAICRDRGIPAAFLWLPESREFQSWVPADVSRRGEEYLAGIRREFGVPLIDARGWIADDRIVDGFHPSCRGAEELSRKLGPAVAGTFPQLRKGSP